MAKKPEITEENDYAGVAVVKGIEPLTQEFSHVSEMNILRDKINEIIERV